MFPQTIPSVWFDILLILSILIFSFLLVEISHRRKVKQQIKGFFVYYLNKRAEKLLSKLSEIFIRLSNHADLSNEMKRALAFHHGAVNITCDVETKYTNIIRSYFVAMKNDGVLENIDKSRIIYCFETIDMLLTNKKSVGSMLCYIADADEGFEKEYRDCLRAIEDFRNMVS